MYALTWGLITQAHLGFPGERGSRGRVCLTPQPGPLSTKDPLGGLNLRARATQSSYAGGETR